MERVGLSETVWQAILSRNSKASGLSSRGTFSIAIIESIIVISWSSHSMLWNNYRYLFACIVRVSLIIQTCGPNAIDGCISTSLAIGANMVEVIVAMYKATFIM